MFSTVAALFGAVGVSTVAWHVARTEGVARAREVVALYALAMAAAYIDSVPLCIVCGAAVAYRGVH